MNRLMVIGNFLILFFIFLIIIINIKAYAMDRNFKVIIEPQEFDVSHMVLNKYDRFSVDGAPFIEFIVPSESPMIPENFEYFTFDKNFNPIYKAGAKVNLPSKVTIKIESKNLKDFFWHKVQIPVVIRVMYHKSMPSKGLFMSFLNKKTNEKVNIVEVDPKAWSNFWNLTSSHLNDSKSIYNKPITHETASGSSDYWNMTYYYKLPRHSISYQIWVTVRGIETEKKDFEIEFYVDDIKITEENFDEMAISFPELLTADPIGHVWPDFNK